MSSKYIGGHAFYGIILLLYCYSTATLLYRFIGTKLLYNKNYALLHLIYLAPHQSVSNRLTGIHSYIDMPYRQFLLHTSKYSLPELDRNMKDHLLPFSSVSSQ